MDGNGGPWQVTACRPLAGAARRLPAAAHWACLQSAAPHGTGLAAVERLLPAVAALLLARGADPRLKVRGVGDAAAIAGRMAARKEEVLAALRPHAATGRVEWTHQVGRLPGGLGGMLQDQFGGVADETFVAVLTEDHGEALREGEFGDEMVSVEDRLITSSLKGYVGAERRQVKALFQLFACFPEDVPVPTALFDRLAMASPPLFGMEAGTKRPHLRVRSWLTGLKKLSLLLGTMLDGFFMHDIGQFLAPLLSL